MSKRICKNCPLYNVKKSHCSVVILMEGTRINMPMEPEEDCFFEEQVFNPETGTMESFAEDIQEVKFWVENEKGEKIDGNGIVKISYPEGFFGDLDE